MIRAILLAVFVALLTGCALLEPVLDQTGDALRRYCREPADTRAAIERQINEHAAPASVKINCPPPKPAPPTSSPASPKRLA